MKPFKKQNIGNILKIMKRSSPEKNQLFQGDPNGQREKTTEK